MFTRRGFLKLLWRAFATGALLAGYSIGVEAMGRPRIVRYGLTPPNWPKGLKLTIAALADIHACQPWMSAARVKAIADQTNELGADVIVLLGDYVVGMRPVTGEVPAADWARALEGLTAPLGVHAVLGNHDYWEDDAVQLAGGGQTEAEKALLAVGIPVYVNQVKRLEKDGQGFWLAGLGDQIALLSGRRYGRGGIVGLENLSGTLAQVTDEAPVILLAHEPDIFADAPTPRVSLTLCGHTHGGQVNLFGWKPVVPSAYGSRFAGGHVVENGRNLIVSRGLGCTGLPIRLGAWPEIVLIELG